MTKNDSLILTEDFLRQRYVIEKKNMKEIGEEVNVSTTGVYKYLAKFGITRTTLANVLTKDFLWQRYIVEKKNTTEIGKETGVSGDTVRLYLKKYGIPRRNPSERRSNSVDSSGFINLTTDWHAYWIGFLAADGCVFSSQKEKLVKFQLHLKGSEVEHIRNFQQGIHSSNQVFVRSYKGNESAIITIYDKVFIDAIAKWGIVPNKTMNMTWPTHLPSNLIPAYIRGYFDGDGTVYQRHRHAPGTSWTETACRFICGSVPFLEELSSILNERGVQTLAIYRNQKTNAFFLPVSTRRENLLTFSRLIYAGSTVCLERKRVIFQEMERYHVEHPRKMHFGRKTL